MTLVQLRHLIALADSGSFSKAAQTCFVTQPALSRSIRALEDELGMTLADRVGRRAEITPSGESMVMRARKLLDDADALKDRSQRLRGLESGSLRVGMGSGPGAMLMVPLMQLVARERPGLRLDIARSATDLLVQALRARTLDALVIDVRWLRPATDLQIESVREMRGAFMVRRDHPLAKRRKPLKFDELLAYPIASTPLSDEVARILIQRYGPRAHPEQCVRLRCEDIASLVTVAESSNAVLLTVRAAGPSLVELKTDPPLDATARLGLVTLANRSEVPALSIVRTLMQEALGDASKRSRVATKAGTAGV
jgi:DNA-binding transcriptional LysR family regulator